MKNESLKPRNIIVNGKRTTVKLSNIEMNVARDLADFHNMKLNDYLVALIDMANEIDKSYGRSMGIRDGIIAELYSLLVDYDKLFKR